MPRPFNAQKQELFHGGIPGLRTGALILPPDTTGAADTTRRYAVSTSAARHPGWVYLTPDPEIAAAYAAMYPDGDLYMAQPLSPLHHDPMSPTRGVMWRCRIARVRIPVMEHITLQSQPHLIAQALEAFETGDISDTDRKIAAILADRPWLQPPGWDPSFHATPQPLETP